MMEGIKNESLRKNTPSNSGLASTKVGVIRSNDNVCTEDYIAETGIRTKGTTPVGAGIPVVVVGSGEVSKEENSISRVGMEGCTGPARPHIGGDSSEDCGSSDVARDAYRDVDGRNRSGAQGEARSDDQCGHCGVHGAHIDVQGDAHIGAKGDAHIGAKGDALIDDQGDAHIGVHGAAQREVKETHIGVQDGVQGGVQYGFQGGVQGAENREGYGAHIAAHTSVHGAAHRELQDAHIGAQGGVLGAEIRDGHGTHAAQNVARMGVQGADHRELKDAPIGSQGGAQGAANRDGQDAHNGAQSVAHGNPYSEAQVGVSCRATKGARNRAIKGGLNAGNSMLQEHKTGDSHRSGKEQGCDTLVDMVVTEAANFGHSEVVDLFKKGLEIGKDANMGEFLDKEDSKFSPSIANSTPNVRSQSKQAISVTPISLVKVLGSCGRSGELVIRQASSENEQESDTNNLDENSLDEEDLDENTIRSRIVSGLKKDHIRLKKRFDKRNMTIENTLDHDCFKDFKVFP